MLSVNFWIGGKKEDCNDTGNNINPFEYIFGGANRNNPNNIKLYISKEKIVIQSNYKSYKAIQDAWRRAVLIYRMKYNDDLNLDERNIEVNEGNEVTPANIKEWIGITFLEKGFDSPLGGNWKDEDGEFLNIIAHNTKSDILNNPAFVCMYNYLASKTQRYDMDRFFYLWMAVNGYYNALTQSSLGYIANDYFHVLELPEKLEDAEESEEWRRWSEWVDRLDDGIPDREKNIIKQLGRAWEKEKQDELYKQKKILKLGKFVQDKKFSDYDRISFLENLIAKETGYLEDNDKFLFFANQAGRNFYFEEALLLDDKSYQPFSTYIKNLSRDIRHECKGLNSSEVWKIVYDFSYELMKSKLEKTGLGLSKDEYNLFTEQKDNLRKLLSAFNYNIEEILFLLDDDPDQSRLNEIIGQKDNQKIKKEILNDDTQPEFSDLAKMVIKCLKCLREVLSKVYNAPSKKCEAYFLNFFFTEIAIIRGDDSVVNKTFPLFALFLYEYPYHWRNQLFHAKRTPALFSIPDDAETETFDMLSYFLDRYLSERIPNLIITTSCLRDDNDNQARDNEDIQIKRLADFFLDVMMDKASINKKDYDKKIFRKKDDDGKYKIKNVSNLIWGK